MSAAWGPWTDPPGDPIADVQRAYRDLLEAAPPKPRADRVKVSALGPLLEHVETRGYAVDPDLGQRLPLAYGLPVFVDETVEAGWVEVWLRDELVDRFRVA